MGGARRGRESTAFARRVNGVCSSQRTSCLSTTTKVTSRSRCCERERVRSAGKEAGESVQSSECGNEELEGGGLGG
jgi:hypothetical protein